MARYAGSVHDQYHRYVMPQENGNKTDTRWFSLCRKEETGLLVGSVRPFEFGVSHYSGPDLHAARHINELRARAETFVQLDVHQRGVGTGACGPDTLPAYRIGPGLHRLGFWLAPPSTRSGQSPRTSPWRWAQAPTSPEKSADPGAYSFRFQS